jgi:hypothetical protein
MKSLLIIAAAVAPLLSLGCKQEVLCPALGDCGGPRDPMTGHSLPPLGEWVLRPGHPSCSEDLYVPANDTRLGLANLPPLGTPLPEPAVFDWCVLLVTGPGAGQAIQARQPRFYYESGPIGKANVKYEANGNFNAETTRIGTFTLDFPSYCVRAFGAQDGPANPDDPASPVVHVCKRLEEPVKGAGIGEGSYFNLECIPNPDDPPGREGCLCTFDVIETGGPAGTYFLQNDNTIVHLGKNFPQPTTFCQDGDRLQLTGANGLYLFDQRGLRTFDLVRLCNSDAECASGSCDLASVSCR